MHACMHCPASYCWPSGSEWWINYTAASYLTVDYESYFPPEVSSVSWYPTCPYPYVEATTPRQGEPVAIRAIVHGSDLESVQLSYRANGGNWWNTSCTSGLPGSWFAYIPGQLGNTTVEFFVTVYDSIGETDASSLYTYVVQSLLVGDIDGDGDVDIFDIVMAATNYGKTYP